MVHECTECGHESVRSYGKCPNCGAWNTLVERVVRKASSLPSGRIPPSSSSAAARNGALRFANRSAAAWVGAGAHGASNVPVSLEELRAADAMQYAAGEASAASAAASGRGGGGSADGVGVAASPRVLVTRSAEFNRVFGGGIVPGSVSLIGGEPGVAKSTLALQVAADVAAGSVGAVAADGAGAAAAPVMYVSGEESVEQVRARADRILAADDDGGEEQERVGDDGSGGARRQRRLDNLYLMNEACVEAILDVAERMHPSLLVIDSIQTVYTAEPDGGGGRAGSVTQIRESAHQLLMAAKSRGTMAVLLIGHVTKTGDLAGPRLLEHLVDTVVYVEGERNSNYRLLRGVKNRFGAAETGVFDLTSRGLRDVRNPSLVFLGAGASSPNSQEGGDDGSAVAVILDGNRGFLVEIQALASESFLPQPRRTANGVEASRVHVILAVLGKRAHLRFANRDVYVNAAGGARVQDPAADLAIAVALASSLTERRVQRRTAFVGEVGLGGEVRNVPRAELRFRDAARLGFRRCVCSSRVTEEQAAQAMRIGMELVRCASVKQALYHGLT